MTSTGTVTGSYSSGSVTGSSNVGGLIGSTSGTITTSYFDQTTSGRTYGVGSNSAATGVTGLTTANMRAYSTFSSTWSIASSGGSSSTWRIYDGYTYPLLRTFLTSLAVADVSTTYTGALQYGTSLSLSNISGSAASGTNAGTYTNTFYSNQQGYDLSGDGTLTIAQAPLTITGSSASTTYTGIAQTLSGYTVSGLVGSDTTSSLSGVSASVSGTDAGSYTNSVTASTQTNYTVTTADGTLTIAKAPLTITGSSATTTYTGSVQTVSGYTVSGLVGTDTTSSLSGVSASGASGTNAGSYTNAVTASTQTNYAVSTVNGTLTISVPGVSSVGSSATVLKPELQAFQMPTRTSVPVLIGGDTEASYSDVVQSNNPDRVPENFSPP
jgi:hypothetical protein